jgi:hypothetical protein
VPGNDGPYAPAWRRYRRQSRAFWLVFVLYIPAIAALNRALVSAQRDNPTAIALAAFAGLVAFAAIGYRKWNFRCPRCGELFFHRFDDRAWRMDWQHRPWARRCLHCGLPKWAGSGAAD